MDKLFYEELVKYNHLIYIDTSSIMNSYSFITFMESIKEILQNNHKKIIILGAVDYELHEHLKSEYFTLKTAASKSLDYIYGHKELFDLKERGKFETFADKTFLIKAIENMSDKKQLFITEDYKLADDIYMIRDAKSCYIKPIIVCGINEQGELFIHQNKKQDQLEKVETSNVEPTNIEKKIEEKTVNISQFENKSKIDNKVASALGFVVGTLVTCLVPFVIKGVKVAIDNFSEN